jgi:hypothetical protein
MVNLLFERIISFTFEMFSSVHEVEGRPGLSSSSSIDSEPLRNRSGHFKQSSEWQQHLHKLLLTFHEFLLHSYQVWNKISCSLVHDHCFPSLRQGSKTLVHKNCIHNWARKLIKLKPVRLLKDGYITRSRDCPQFRCPSATSSASSAAAPFTVCFDQTSHISQLSSYNGKINIVFL